MIEQVYLIYRWNPNRFYPSGHSRAASNDNEDILHIPQSSWNGASLSDGFVSYPGHFLRVGVLPICRDAVGIFYSLRWLAWEVLNNSLCLLNTKAQTYLDLTSDNDSATVTPLSILTIPGKYMTTLVAAITSSWYFAQSVGAVEYTDCIFTER